MNARLHCASATPWSAASRHHRAASAWSCKTPVPFVHSIPMKHCAPSSPWSGEPAQPHCLGVVLWDPGAAIVQHPEETLPPGVPLVGGEPAPPRRLGVVLGDPGAIRVHQPEVEMPAGGALVGGEPLPPHCLGVVLLDPGAVLVHQPEVKVDGAPASQGLREARRASTTAARQTRPAPPVPAPQPVRTSTAPAPWLCWHPTC